MNSDERRAVRRVLDAYGVYLDTDNLDVLRDALTHLAEVADVTTGRKAER